MKSQHKKNKHLEEPAPQPVELDFDVISYVAPMSLALLFDTGSRGAEPHELPLKPATIRALIQLSDDYVDLTRNSNNCLFEESPFAYVFWERARRLLGQVRKELGSGYVVHCSSALVLGTYWDDLP